MRELSPHFRYRVLPRLLIGGGSVLGVAAVAAVVLFVLPSHQADLKGKTTNQPAQIVESGNTGKTVPLDREATRVAQSFINAAVTRKDMATGWNLLGDCLPNGDPCLKKGLTRKAWMAGQSPIAPYPVEGGVKFKIDESHARDALLEVAAFPPRGNTAYKPQVFFLTLHRYGTGHKAPWKVVYWVPHATSVVPASAY
jgi:hypothetical protein